MIAPDGRGAGMIAPDGCGGFKMRGVRPQEWTPARKATFLDHLTMTCNVAASAAAAGMDRSTPYRLRQRDAAFAAAWATAIRAGAERLHEQLVAYALRGLEHAGTPAAEAPGAPPFDPMLALRILALPEIGGGGGRRRQAGKAYKRVPIDEVERTLLAKLDRIAAHEQDDGAVPRG